MPYYSPEVVARAREMDLLTYLKNYEPQEWSLPVIIRIWIVNTDARFAVDVWQRMKVKKRAIGFPAIMSEASDKSQVLFC